MPEVPPTKQGLRAAALARRDALGETEREAASALIAERVGVLVERLRPRAIAGYRPYGTEADAGFERASSWPSQFGLATMMDRDLMVFRRSRAGDVLVPDALGILAPAPGAEIVEPDLWLVPVSAFDRTGARIGKGRGVYDRAVAVARAGGADPLLVGIAFSVQEVPSIPHEPHDVRLDWIVTEKETLSFPKSS